MEIAELDLFRDEDMEYAARVMKAGVSVDVYIRPGCSHGWEHIAPSAAVTKKAMQDR